MNSIELLPLSRNDDAPPLSSETDGYSCCCYNDGISQQQYLLTATGTCRRQGLQIVAGASAGQGSSADNAVATASLKTAAEAVSALNDEAVRNAQLRRWDEAERALWSAIAELGGSFSGMADKRRYNRRSHTNHHRHPCSSPSPSFGGDSSRGVLQFLGGQRRTSSHLQSPPSLSLFSSSSSSYSPDTDIEKEQRQQQEQQQSERIVDHRLQYDEGWSRCTEFLNFFDVFASSGSGPLASGRASSVSTPSLPSPAEMATVLLYNAGLAMFLCDREAGKDGDDDDADATSAAMEVLLEAYNLATSSASTTASCSSSCSSLSHLLAARILQAVGCIQYLNEDIEQAIDTFEEALDHHQQAFAGRSSDVDEENAAELASAATTLNCLGVLYFHLPEADTAKSGDYLHMALELQQRLLDSVKTSAAAFGYKRDIGTTLNNIGRVQFTSNQLEKALDSYDKAIRIRRSLLGNNHTDVAATVYNAGQTLHQMGDLDRALENYKEFARITFRLDRPNRYLVVVLKCIALIYHEQKSFEQALGYFNQALVVARDILGSMHPDTASILNKLGNLHYELGDFDTSLRMYREGLAVERVVFDANHLNITVTLSNIAQIHKQRGNAQSALKLYGEVLSIQRKTCDPSDPSLAITLSNIGLIHYQTKSYLPALDSYQESLRIRREYYGDDSLDVASCLNSIGLVLFRVGLSELALQSFGESLRIRRIVQGDQHRDIAIIMSNLATIYLDLGNESEAIRCYNEALKVERAALGELDDEVIATLQFLAMVHQKQGEIVPALDCYREVLRILILKDPDDKGCIAQILNTIANLHLQRGDAKNAMESICEATRIVRRSGGDENCVQLSGFDFYGLSTLYPEAAPSA